MGVVASDCYHTNYDFTIGFLDIRQQQEYTVGVHQQTEHTGIPLSQYFDCSVMVAPRHRLNVGSF